MMRQAERLIRKFGGQAAMARALKHRNPTTVDRWKEAGYIRPYHYEKILDAAEEQGIKLTADDFVIIDPDHPKLHNAKQETEESVV